MTGRSHHQPARRCPAAADKKRPDQGAVTVELVLATPLLLTLLLLAVQFAVWQHAQHLTQAAANQALTATKAEHGTSRDGQAAATTVLDTLGRHVITDATIQIHRDDDQTTVQVRGHAAQILPWLHLPTRARNSGRTEHFRPDLNPGQPPQ